MKNLQKQPLKIAVDNIINQCIQHLSVQKDPAILSIKMQLLVENDYKNRGITHNKLINSMNLFIHNFYISFTGFIINKCNEENDQKIRPLLNNILDNIDHADNTMSIYNQKIIQYIILSNYMGDPTSPIFVQEISGK